jgi:hypothetical protein
MRLPPNRSGTPSPVINSQTVTSMLCPDLARDLSNARFSRSSRRGHGALRAFRDKEAAPFEREPPERLLNLNCSVGSEFLLALDACLARCLELHRVANLVEQRVGINERINTEAVLGGRP